MTMLAGMLPALSLATAIHAAPLAEPGEPHLFGTHALIAAQPPYLRWPGLRTIRAPYPLARMVRPFRDNSRAEQVAIVNRMVQSRIRYGKDLDMWGLDDYWAAPQETWIRRQGDCEDMALLKRSALIELGVPEEHLLMLVGRRQDGRDHAMLGVWVDNDWLFLDDGQAPLRSSQLKGFEPVISLIGERTYVHGRDRLAPRPAASAK